MAASGGGGPHVQTAIEQSPKALHFRRIRDVVLQPVPHSTDVQDGRALVTLIKNKIKKISCS